LERVTSFLHQAIRRGNAAAVATREMERFEEFHPQLRGLAVVALSGSVQLHIDYELDPT
jgi:hypothetical protein